MEKETVQNLIFKGVLLWKSSMDGVYTFLSYILESVMLALTLECVDS